MSDLIPTPIHHSPGERVNLAKTSSRVVVRMRGGLGNQLFCYATARRLALVNQAELVIDPYSGFRKRHIRRVCELHHFYLQARLLTETECNDPVFRIRNAWQRAQSHVLPLERSAYIREREPGFDPRLLQRRVRGTVYLNGLWQSAAYFADIEDVLRQDLRICAPTDRQNLDAAERICGSESVAVHVRFFRKVANTDAAMSRLRNYYRQAMDELATRLRKPEFLVFSDDPGRASEILDPGSHDLSFISHNLQQDSAYADLWLMSQCRHFIIADSTFSWWGAWLGKALDKQVIAPGTALLARPEHWGFAGQLPCRWTIVPGVQSMSP